CRGSFFSSATSFSKAMTLSLNQKTKAKSGIKGGILVVSIFGGGVGVVYRGGEVKLPQNLPKDASNFTLLVIETMITESLNQANLAKASSQPQSTYEATATLTEFELKKILIDKMNSSIKSQPKSSGKSVHAEEPEFEFTKPSRPQEPTDPDWNEDKTRQKEPTQNWLMTLAAFTSIDKSLKEFDELMSTLIDFSSYFLNGLKIENLTQEILLGPAFRLLKGTRSNYKSGYSKVIQRSSIGVRSYQKQINVTKPDTIRPDLKKRHPYTPYKDPQGFIYVDDYQRNRLMRFDELYKFSDGTLTRLLSSLEDITKNIDMKYLPKRRWKKLEKKRAYFMVKDINKLLKKRRMMRSLKKFVSGRLYKTDLRLLQRTI
nr:hypothetical protein [Tanacetum cinerariifolium]